VGFVFFLGGVFFGCGGGVGVLSGGVFSSAQSSGNEPGRKSSEGERREAAGMGKSTDTGKDGQKRASPERFQRRGELRRAAS